MRVEGGGAGTQDGAGNRVVYGRIFVQQRSAALARVRQALMAALDDEAQTRNQSMSASEYADHTAQRRDDGQNLSAAALGVPHDVAYSRTRQLLETTHRALTCASSTAEGMHRTLSAKHGRVGIGRGRGGAGAGGDGEDGGDDQVVMVAEVRDKSRQMLQEIASCQQQFAAAGQALKREMA